MNLVLRIVFAGLVNFFFLSQLSGQQTFVRGIVKDSATGEPLIGAIVSASSGGGSATDIAGNYLIKTSAGEQTITVKYTGYNDYSNKITVKQGEIYQLDILMVNSSKQLNLVVISSGRYEQKIGEVPVSMEVIKPQLIQNKNTTNLETIIDQTPGVNMTDGQANIRGGSGYSFGAGSRVLLVVDDMPMLSGDAGDVKWNYLPVENVSQVEVMKGASSAVFGSSALNGVIHFRTAYPTDKPQTTITMFSGLYDNPKRASLNWWGKTNPAVSGINFGHSQKIGNLDLVLGGHLFDDDGYRYLETEQRQRMNVNTRYRFKNVPGLTAGVNANWMHTTGGLFILWYDDSLAYTPADSTIQKYINYRYNIDPYISYFGKKGHRHSLRTRFFRTDNNNDTKQGSLADLYYGEYQYQFRFKNQLTVTSGVVYSYSNVKSDLYLNHTAENVSAYAQLDRRFFDRLFVTIGFRAEYFRVDTANTEFRANLGGNDTIVMPFRPVGRIGVNYQAAEATYIRVSYGQGYRFPAIAEKFVRTSASGLEIYPNAGLQPEYGQSAEVGIKQGIKFGKWMGYADASLFWMEYNNMIEFTFGQWGRPGIDPFFGLGFKSLNIGSTRTTGVDVSLMGQGDIGKVNLVVLGGYTYMNPVSLRWDPAVDTVKNTSKENILKYRYKHIAKFDAEASYKMFSLGMSMRYNSFMENIDKFFEAALPGIKDYRINNKHGDIVFDSRLIYRLNETARISVIVNNVFNREYTSRPADVQPPRTFILQLQVKF
ncbi:MAG: hypothetical protein Fur0041_16350 [Bacteroidia bacterium]